MDNEKFLDGIAHAVKAVSTPCLYKGHFTLENPVLWDDAHGGGHECYVGSYAEDHGEWFAKMRIEHWWGKNAINYPGWVLIGVNPLSSPFFMAGH